MKSGFVAVIGRANAGKSTLINVLVGEKVSIVSPRPQTTRDRILGVLTEKDLQIAFVDTPGLYAADNMLNSVMQKTAEDAAKDVDAIMFLIDCHGGISERDKSLFKKYSSQGVPVVCVLTKIDIMPESLLISCLKDMGESFPNAEIVPVSARKGKNLKELKSVMARLLPDGEKLFEEDIISDRSEKFMITEIMREKILLKFDDEIPHGIAITVNKFRLRDDGSCYDVDLDIICEKQGHKAILIGKNGAAIKETSSFAREGMEKFLGKKVFLKTYVKVREDWRNSPSLIKEHGYGEDRG